MYNSNRAGQPPAMQPPPAVIAAIPIDPASEEQMNRVFKTVPGNVNAFRFFIICLVFLMLAMNMASGSVFASIIFFLFLILRIVNWYNETPESFRVTPNGINIKRKYHDREITISFGEVEQVYMTNGILHMGVWAMTNSATIVKVTLRGGCLVASYMLSPENPVEFFNLVQQVRAARAMAISHLDGNPNLPPPGYNQPGYQPGYGPYNQAHPQVVVVPMAYPPTQGEPQQYQQQAPAYPPPAYTQPPPPNHHQLQQQAQQAPPSAGQPAPGYPAQA
eukprot:TRINITY_DN1190_c0_g1_i1.p1 TRINITY_DN1190_c0_g1~~TRINITY_DN1190_c0_g1_i1.p1  ORF type:complete len:276 (-),score=51.52 TRINITY_DN1190_c0_g1_i1:39-866(-)